MTQEPRQRLLEGYTLANKLWPIYYVQAGCRLINAIGLKAFQAFYINRPNQIAEQLRKYILAC